MTEIKRKHFTPEYLAVGFRCSVGGSEPMNWFRMKAIAEGDEGLRSIWLVVADNLFDAVNLVPAGHVVESMAVGLDPNRGLPSRMGIRR